MTKEDKLAQCIRSDCWDTATFAAVHDAMSKDLDIERMLIATYPSLAVNAACRALRGGYEWGDDGLRLEKVAMAVMNSNEEPEIFITHVVVTKDQYLLGMHYDAAIETAVELGYDAGEGKALCFDASEFKSIIAAGRTLNDSTIHLVWSTDDIIERNAETNSGVELTESQCREILGNIERGHDAEQGVSWDTVDAYTQTYIAEHDLDSASGMEP